MTRHILKNGAKLNADERAALEKRVASQRVNADQMLERLRKQREREVDFITDTRNLEMVPIPVDTREQLEEIDEQKRLESKKPTVAIIPADRERDDFSKMTGGPIAVNAHAHGQLATHVGIPKPYYDRMLSDDPELLAFNVNRWLHQQPTNRLVRAFDARTINETQRRELSMMRAFLSDKYRRIDSLEIAESFVPMLADERTGWTIHQCGLTELKMHIEAQMPSLTTEIVVGDPVSLAMKFETSDVGSGAISLSLGVHRLECTNLLIVPSFSKRQIHVGRTQDEFAEMLSDRTLKLEDELVIRKLREYVAALANREQFMKIAGLLKKSAEYELEQPIGATQLLAKNVGLRESELVSVQNEMTRAGDPTMWGLTNALTATARSLDFERKSELERAAGKLVEQPESIWKQYATVVEEVAA